MLLEERHRLHRLPEVAYTAAFGETRKVSWSATISYGGVVGTTYLLFSTSGQSFNGLGYHIGAVVDVPVAQRVGLIGKVGYESKVGGGTVSEGGVSADMSFNHDYVELAGAVRYDVAPGMLVEGGLALQLGTGGTFRVDANDGDDRVSAGRDGELTMPTQIAITAGTGYRIKVGPTAEIIPHASFNLFLTSPTPTGSASSHTIRVGTRVMFN